MSVVKDTRYLVVEFPKGPKETTPAVETVPASWVNEQELISKWPNGKPNEVSKAINEMYTPQSTWSSYRLSRILYRCDNLLTAKQRAKDAELNSVSESSHSDELRHKRRKRRGNPRYLSDESSSTDETSVVDDPSKPSFYDTTPAIPNFLYFKRKNQGSAGLSSSSLHFDDTEMSPTHFSQSSATSPSIISAGKANMSRNSPVSVAATPNKAPLDTSQHMMPMPSSQHRPVPEKSNSTSYQETVLQTLANISYTLERIQKRLSRIELQSTVFRDGKENRCPELPEGVQLPIASMEASYLSFRIGQNNVVDRLLTFLLSDIFSTQLNWAGRNGKRAVKKTKFVEFIKYTVEKNLKIADEVVEAKIKSWLKHSSDRLKRERNKN
ncbi:uncharacterized protein LOC129229598 isoform X2 [Uloborus diversus]|uniref:uncharacterized protein LOC129229598 isoform X2 n=1 Tax=Uloborus diversus TaxID=327109 RepID=UPI002409015B|nr:uncharacterized protein LOC129229598 isoform X2 [Uloborus diversus]